MSNPIHLQPAFVLHRRPYRETSCLLDLFCRDYGRISAVAKGVRQVKSRTQGLLQPFAPLLVSWVGKGELMTLTHSEANGVLMSLQGDRLFAGFYLNELMTILLPKWDAQPAIFELYTGMIETLHADVLNERALRHFEMKLLEALGYGLLLKRDSHLRETLVSEKYYRFVSELGFVEASAFEVERGAVAIFSGKSLLAIANETWDDENCLKDAKRLSRFLLAPLLGQRTIHSRKLFVVPIED